MPRALLRGRRTEEVEEGKTEKTKKIRYHLESKEKVRACRYPLPCLRACCANELTIDPQRPFRRAVVCAQDGNVRIAAFIDRALALYREQEAGKVRNMLRNTRALAHAQATNKPPTSRKMPSTKGMHLPQRGCVPQAW